MSNSTGIDALTHFIIILDLSIPFMIRAYIYDTVLIIRTAELYVGTVCHDAHLFGSITIARKVTLPTTTGACHEHIMQTDNTTRKCNKDVFCLCYYLIS